MSTFFKFFYAYFFNLKISVLLHFNFSTKIQKFYTLAFFNIHPHKIPLNSPELNGETVEMDFHCVFDSASDSETLVLHHR